MKTHEGTVGTVIVLCAVLSCRGLWAYSGGTGAPEDPYLISTPEDMSSIGLNQDDWDKHFRLTEDIDLSGYTGNQFNLIGLYAASQDPNEAMAVPFSGVFDGQGHVIANFTYVVQGDENPAQGWVRGVGLFRLIDGADSEIKDLTLLDPNLHPSSTCIQRVGAIGALAGVVRSGLIVGCHVERGCIRAEGNAGGLVGAVQRHYGDGASDPPPTISSCSTNCDVARAAERLFVDVERADSLLHTSYGGLLGFNSGTVSNCWAAGPVSGGRIVGGLVGLNYEEITSSYATNDVSGQTDAGGLVGQSSYGTISSCWASGDVNGITDDLQENTSLTGSIVGGLVGSSLYDTVSNCHASGRVTGESHIGGLVGGCNRSTIEDCYATGSVTAANQQAGGLAGSVGLDTVVSKCYACASVSVPWAGGGLVGFNGGTIRSSWADGVVSGTSGIGGLVGEQWRRSASLAGIPVEFNGVIIDCYALADVVCDGAQAGGLLGANEDGAVLRCFAAGRVTGCQDIGGLLGHESKGYPSRVEQSFWDEEASGLSVSASGIGLSTSQMQDRATYIEAGWDLTDETLNGDNDVWVLDPNAATYPRLAWESQPDEASDLNNVNDIAGGLH